MIFQHLEAFRDVLWRGPLLVLLPSAGLLLTLRLGGLQWRRLGLALRLAVSRESEGAGEISSFAALCTALSATLGTGNIVGVAIAIAAGGPGALFWMWVSAFLGMATKYAEGFLAIRFRTFGPNGRPCGGPYYYMARGLGRPMLGKWFALFTALAAVCGIGTCAQMSGIVTAAQNFFDPEGRYTVRLCGADYGWVLVIAGAVTTVCAALILRGGTQRIARFSTVAVPVMALLYVAATGTILVLNRKALPGVLRGIVESAFGLRAAAGGGAAAVLLALENGLARGVFSNEAGLGSAPIAAASARTNDPVRQGLITMTGTFLDTLVLCTLTGLSILVTGAHTRGLTGAAVTVDAFRRGLPFLPPRVSEGILTVSLIAFAFTTITGWCFYGEKSLEYLLPRAGTRVVKCYRMLYVLILAAAPYLSVRTAWTIADICNGLMALPNLAALIGLSGLVARETGRYFRRGN